MEERWDNGGTVIVKDIMSGSALATPELDEHQRHALFLGPMVPTALNFGAAMAQPRAQC